MGMIKEGQQGRLLLRFFRDEQKKKERDGCLCIECEQDMQRAWEKFNGIDTV